MFGVGGGGERSSRGASSLPSGAAVQRGHRGCWEGLWPQPGGQTREPHWGAVCEGPTLGLLSLSSLARMLGSGGLARGKGKWGFLAL